MSWLSELFHPDKPYKAAQGEFNKYYQQGQNNYQQGQGALNPYNQQGQQSGGTLQDMLAQLQNPEQLQNQWAQNYQQSPYAQQMQKMSQDAGLNAASSQGLLGSSAALQNIQQQSGNIVNQDRQQYLNDLMQKYMQGIGLGENIYGTGAGAAGQQAGLYGQQGQSAQNAGQYGSQLEFGGKSALANMRGNIIGGTAALAGNYLTGGLGSGAFGRGALQPNWLKPQQSQWQNPDQFMGRQM